MLARAAAAPKRSYGDIDATLQTRWRRVAASLGRNTSWKNRPGDRGDAMSARPAVPVIDRWQTQLEIGSIRAASTEPWVVSGRITRATGLVLHATGLRLPVGAAARIEIARGHDHWADAEVVGFDGHTLYLMPQADISGLPPGARVVPGEPPVQRQIPLPSKAELNGNAKPQLGRHLPVGNAPLGRVLDGAGRPLDGWAR